MIHRHSAALPSLRRTLEIWRWALLAALAAVALLVLQDALYGGLPAFGSHRFSRRDAETMETQFFE